MSSVSPQRILITGASSGLGTSLALAYAAEGVTLYLHGRHQLRLNKVAEACKAQGATVHTEAGDVKNTPHMQQWLAAVLEQGALDLVIANAGISGGTAEGDEEVQQVREIFLTNVIGVSNTVQPVLASMRQAGKGQIAIIASLAGFRGFPGAPAYCGSKAAVKVYGEGLRGLLAGNGIGVTVVCPGYVKTAMTDANDFSMPLMWPAEKAARVIKAGIAKNKARIAFPWPLYSIVWLLSVLPAGLVDRLLATLPKKSGISAKDI